MATGSGNKLALDHDYPIRGWEAAGPVKPSIARLDRIILIPNGYLGSAGLIDHLSGSRINTIPLPKRPPSRYELSYVSCMALKPILT